MAESINWDNIYKDYVGQYTTGLVETDVDYAAKVAAAQRKAGELAAYGRLTGSRQDPTPYYSLNEWIDYSAPSYKSVRNYKGTDPATVIISNSIKGLEADKNKQFDIGAVNEIANKLTGSGYTRGEAYNVVKGIYDEFQSAKKKYGSQSKTHPYSKFGLPSPTDIYGLTNGSTETFVIDSNGKAVKRKVKVVAYPGASTWVATKTAAYESKLTKQGIDAATARTRALDYGNALKANVEAKIAASGVTPFIEAAAKRSRTRPK
jgi:hypothetical protein